MRRVIGGSFAVLAVLTSCVTRDEAPPGELAAGCVLNSDCASPLVCAFRRCHAQCETNADCVTGSEVLLCVPDEAPLKVCLLSQEARCVYNTDCPAGLSCASDGRCRLACLSNVDCVAGQSCVEGRCAAPQELVDGGLPRVDGGTPGQACLYTSQCPAPRVCLQGACRDECLTDRDCRADETCRAGTCALAAGDGGAGWGQSCLLNSDCPLPYLCGPRNACVFECVESRDCAAGSCCFENACYRGAVCAGGLPDGGLRDGGVPDGGLKCLNDLACDDGNFCNGIELCVNQRCQAPLHPVCDDANPCTVDECHETTRTCSYVELGLDAGDLDGDGHPSAACGGPADDCDDTNPLVHPGQPERCDGLDNNCNGAVDEGLWHERPGARISLNGQSRFNWWAGPPSVVRLENGFLIAVASDTVDGALELVRTDAQLVLAQGPVPLVASRTQWDSFDFNNNGTLVFGKRMLQPRLASNGAEFLLTGFMGSSPGAQRCVATDHWSLELPLLRVDPGLQLDGGTTRLPNLQEEATSAGCTTTAPEAYYPLFTAARLVWSPSIGRWLALWGESSVVAGARYGTIAALVDGGTTNVHLLLAGQPPSDSQLLANYQSYLIEPPHAAALDDRVLVAWQPQSGTRPKLVMLDPAGSSPLTPVLDVGPNSTSLEETGTTSSGDGFYVLLSPTNTPPVVLELSRDGGTARGPWTLAPEQNRATWPSLGLGANTAVRPDVAPARDGYLFTENDWPDVTFGFLSTRNDGGIVTTSVQLPDVQRSQVVVVPLTDTSAGLLWNDGQLKRTIMECTP